ncbi:hypothetical protein CPAR01_10930 [Colletotrichum paranaense]|uniref:Uncharacterized protein n=2 Tax=Colletotrichum acutatum species complex TaxID=2707335 RepID=A0AAI9UW51_9PEZI|nr:uncharacterized protein CPAR01_10930 [Colletotrichum paranaense]KAK1465885.1 hypothetical protein CMEL01_11877 [Colletotrichum melonis]KAK1531281.1 hypothetical protein CPAR01_10930 [Colletotrichum paranaense]
MTVFWYYQPFAGSSSDGVNLERARRFGDTIEQNKPTTVTVDYLQRSRFRAPQMVQRLFGKKLLAVVEPGGQHRGSEAADILRNKSAVGTRIKTHDPNKDPEL